MQTSHGTYIGPRADLKGKTAILQLDGLLLTAQFDDVSTGLGHGWYEFAVEDFQEDPPVDWGDE